MLELNELEKLRHKLDLNETLVWAGKPKSWAFTKTTLVLIPFGLFWNSIVSIFIFGMIFPMWFGDGSGQITINGHATTYGEMSFLDKLWPTLFMVPFVIIGIVTLFSPLWAKIRSSGLIYAVTNKRALCKGRFFTTSWRSSEIYTPDRADKRSGVTHLYFSTRISHGRNGSSSTPTGFYNLPSSEANAAESALKALRNKNKKEVAVPIATMNAPDF